MPPPLAYLACTAARWRISSRTNEGALFTSLIPCDTSSFSIISFSPHLNLKATSQPFILSTLFVRWQKTISPVPEVRNSKSGKFNYGQTSCCSSYRASTNRLACSNTVALGFNGLLKKYISKLTILITGTFSILHRITQKVCGKAVTTTQSQIHQFPGLHLNTESSSSITSLGPKLLPAGPLQKDRNMSCSSRAPKFLGFLPTVLSEQF